MKSNYVGFIAVICFLSPMAITSDNKKTLVLDTKSRLAENHFQFCANVENAGYLSADIYTKVVESLPICCVDVFVYNPHSQKYLMILRKDKPAQNLFFVPGGRLLKGESFFGGAERKIKEETGLDITATQKIDVYSTIFPDSQWGCQTHTINIVIFAVLKPDQKITLDAHHGDYAWVSRDIAPENEYLCNAYHKARLYMH